MKKSCLLSSTKQLFLDLQVPHNLAKIKLLFDKV
jgi:hypothetical protein